MSDKVNEGDDLLVSIDMKEDLTTATSPKILYIKPDGTPGLWNAAVSGTAIVYNASATETLGEGEWQFQAKATMGGKIRRSEIVKQKFYKPLDL